MANGVFWAAAAAIALVVAGILINALRRRPAQATTTAVFDSQVYRDQLREIERDLSRGVIVEDEATRLRSEVARRLLAADRAEAVPELVAVGPSSVLVICAVGLVLAAGFGGYAYLGQPGYGDLPLQARITLAEERRASRPDQAALESALPPRPPLQAVDPAFLELVEKLRTAVAQRPDDLQGQQLLARNEANLGNLTAAYNAQARVIALKGADASAADFLTQATLMVQAADGQVSPEAEALFAKVLQGNPKEDTALFFTGIVNMQVGRYDLAFRYWRELMNSAPEASPWKAEVRTRIESLAEVAGVRYQLPEEPGLRGPSSADLEAAQDMTPEERQAMIRSMVEGLNDRLATEGGTAEEWARLISALANLGEAARAQAILAEAQRNFAGRPTELSFINEAAVTAGLTP